MVGNFKFEVFKVLSIFYPSLMMNDALKFHASLISMRIISILGSSYYHLITANNKNSLWIIINEVLGELQFLWLSFHGVFFITINNKNSLWIIEVLGEFLWLSFYGFFFGSISMKNWDLFYLYYDFIVALWCCDVIVCDRNTYFLVIFFLYSFWLSQTLKFKLFRC